MILSGHQTKEVFYYEKVFDRQLVAPVLRVLHARDNRIHSFLRCGTSYLHGGISGIDTVHARDRDLYFR